MSPPEVIVVTGTSSGPGKLTAEAFAAAGSEVYATTRNSRGSHRDTRQAMLDAATLRTVVGVDYGVSTLKRAVEPVQRALLEGLGLSAIPSDNAKETNQ